MRIVVIGDTEFTTGFQYAGVKDTYECMDSWKAKNILEEIGEMRDVAIVIIPQDIASKIRDFINDWKREKGIYPIILELPHIHQKEKFEDPLRNIIRRAIGVDILKR